MENMDVIDEINYIKKVLTFVDKNSLFKIPRNLETLRKFILLIHIEYEAAAEYIIWKAHFKEGSTFNSTSKIFESITFEKKMQIAKKLAPDFPVKYARKVNEIRN